ncbi:MAG: serpin family protein [Eubacterium sp.]|nr:serpin family protein [Eubacterium sp.]
MKKRVVSFVLALAAASAAFAGIGAWQQEAGNSRLMVQAKEQETADAMQQVQQFGYELMGQYLEETNPVLSPVSAYVALSMVANGAKGTTKKEFENVLGSDTLALSKSLMDTLPQNEEGVQLTIANSAWMDKQFTAKKKWLDTIKTQFQADVYEVNLDTNAAKEKINKWVSGRTNELIPKLLDKKLEKETRLALLNALYFHADWQQQFVGAFTSKSNFRLDHGTNAEVDMMHASIRSCGYFHNKDAQGVVLPYKDSQFAFVAVKPVGETSIRDWYASYSAQKLAALIAGRQTKEVELALPKFEVRCRMNLNDSLKKMGIKKVFDEKKADLTLLGKSADEENLYLSLVLQEAVISVAEEGTEAAAATIGAVATGTAYMPDKPVVYFDRSFMYMIMDMESGAPVFMGIVDQP